MKVFCNILLQKHTSVNKLKCLNGDIFTAADLSMNLITGKNEYFMINLNSNADTTTINQ